MTTVSKRRAAATLVEREALMKRKYETADEKEADQGKDEDVKEVKQNY